jgi:hypothetical protein
MKFNGNIVLNTGGASELQNVIIERLSANPTFSASEKGRIVFNTSDNTYYFNNGTTWSAFATGGNATAIQSEVNAIETSLGSSINGDGSFNAGAFSGFGNVTTPSSITNVLEQLDLAITGQDTLAELEDVALASLANKQVLYYDTGTSKWINHTIVLTDVSDVTTTVSELNELHSAGAVQADFIKLHAVTATAAELNILDGALLDVNELNILDGATLTTTELNYLDGVTSAVQTQLDNKQPLDPQLTSIAQLTPTAGDVLVGKVDGTYELLTGAGFRSSLGLAIGVNVQAWDADLDTIAAFAPAADSSESITINGSTFNKTGLNDIIVGTGGVEGARWTLERGATARDSLGLGDIAIMDEQNFIRADAASSNVANDISFNSYKITNLGAGTSGTDAINKNQLDAAVAGLSWKQAVAVATTPAGGNVDLTTGGLLTIDGYTLTAGERVLVKNQTTASQNGVYVAAAGAWTRATDADSAAELEGLAVFVQRGTTNTDSAWTQTADGITLGTTAIAFTQFAGSLTAVAGIGLLQNGNQIDVQLGAGIVELPSDEVGIDLYDPNTSALILTSDATSRSTNTNAKLHLLLDLSGNGKLVQSSAGLKVSTNTITEAELTASVAGDGLVGGNNTPLAVVSAPGTAGLVGTLVVTANNVGVELGTTSTTAARGDHIHSAAVVTFDDSVTLLGGNPANVQDAIEAIDTTLENLGDVTGDIQTEVNAIETAVGLNSTGTLIPWTGTNYVNASTTVADAIGDLDTAIKSVETAAGTALTNAVNTLNTTIDNLYFLYDGSSATSHTVTHNLGQRYCNVTVIDTSTSTHEVVIPQAIVFDTANQLTVTFNTSVPCKVVVMGSSIG